MKQLRSFLNYGLTAILCLTFAWNCQAQGYRSKQTIYSHEQSQQLFGFESHGSNYGVQVDYDSFGTYITARNNDDLHVSFNDGFGWRPLISPEIQYQELGFNPFNTIIQTGGGKALVTPHPGIYSAQSSLHFRQQSGNTHHYNCTSHSQQCKY